ncbi:hypothetical protein TRIATDRAFT_310431 [Trichoderma atroviride IMI 206040]|uniref:Uncharacterized protein n=2 Tax=Hypocrea atroviridis TaxID=63577 RepID=G9P383_HYPAI|nr:uncharacterized protein TRIATDRAFT_310431 [Trichoderma atroviride IMI 206040]EHK42845.1 hypothetical protein TRIATDRAFT_310431 [Trichoderma atroviride IMI 206040]
MSTAECLESVIQKPILRLGVRNRFVQDAKAPARAHSSDPSGHSTAFDAAPPTNLLLAPWGDVQRSPTSRPQGEARRPLGSRTGFQGLAGSVSHQIALTRRQWASGKA